MKNTLGDLVRKTILEIQTPVLQFGFHKYLKKKKMEGKINLAAKRAGKIIQKLQ